MVWPGVTEAPIWLAADVPLSRNIRLTAAQIASIAQLPQKQGSGKRRIVFRVCRLHGELGHSAKSRKATDVRLDKARTRRACPRPVLLVANHHRHPLAGGQ